VIRFTEGILVVATRLKPAISLVLIAGCAAMIGCSPEVTGDAEGVVAVNELAASNHDVNELREELERIHLRAKHFDTSSGDWPYFSDAGLQHLYPRSIENLDAVKSLISLNTVDAEIQVLGIRIEQCLPLAEYLTLLEFAANGFLTGQVRPQVLEAAIAPGAEWGTAVVMSYEHRDVIRVLSAVRNSGRATDRLRTVIDGVLSGAQSRFVKGQRDAGATIPVLSCNS